jgi:hypothetical protein
MVISNETNPAGTSAARRPAELPAQEPHRPVTREHVSHCVANRYFQFNTLMFADRLGLPTVRPSNSEDEHFLRLQDLPAIIKAAAEHPDRQPAWKCGDGEPGRFLALVEHEGWRGATDRQIAARRQAVLAGPTQP